MSFAQGSALSSTTKLRCIPNEGTVNAFCSMHGMGWRFIRSCPMGNSGGIYESGTLVAYEFHKPNYNNAVS